MPYFHKLNLPKLEHLVRIEPEDETMHNIRDYLAREEPFYDDSILESISESLGFEGSYARSDRSFSSVTMSRGGPANTWEAKIRKYVRSPPREIQNLGYNIGQIKREILESFPQCGEVLCDGEHYCRTSVNPETTLFDILIMLCTPIGGRIDYQKVEDEAQKKLRSGRFELRTPYDDWMPDKTPVSLEMLQEIDVIVENKSLNDERDLRLSLLLKPEPSYNNLFNPRRFDSVIVPYREAVNIHVRSMTDVHDIEKNVNAFNKAFDMIIEYSDNNKVKVLSRVRKNEGSGFWRKPFDASEKEAIYKHALRDAVEEYKSILRKNDIL